VHVQVAHPLREGVPDVVPERVAAVLLHRRLHPLPELVVRPLAPGDAEHREVARKEMAEGERVEGGEELLLRQVARGAEDHDRAGLWRSRQAEPFEKRVLLLLGSERHDCFSRCPPKAWRMAERSLLANSASPRESKRSYSAAERTGAGT